MNAVHLSGAGTYAVADSLITLHAVVVNTAGTGVTLKDGAGHTIAVIGAVVGSFLYDGDVTGLSVVIVGAADVTVVYKG